MKIKQKKFISLFLAVVILFSIIPAGTMTASAADARLQNAVNWAVSIANDNSHGYSWVGAWRTGPDYDCSSLVGHALYNGGFTGIGQKLKTMNTSNEPGYLTELGFKDVTSSVNRSTGSGLQAGDVLWVSGHTEMCVGNNQLVGAHQSAKPCYCKNNNGNNGWCIGCYNCGELKGDQTGNEISVTKYYNHPWTKVYRFNGGSTSSLGAPTNVKITTEGNKFKVTWNNVSGANCYDVIVTDPSGSQKWWHASSNSKDIPITSLGRYKVEVQSLYRPNGSTTGQIVGAHSNEVVCDINLLGPTNVKAEVSGNKFKITWNSVPGANCYDVIVTDPTGATNWYHSSGTEKIMDIGKPGRYKFDVQSLYRPNGSTSGQIVGAHSGNIVYNLELTAPQNVRFDNADGKFNVYWDSVPGATCYDVVVTKPNGELAWLHTHENHASTDKFESGKYSFWIQGIYRPSCPEKTGQYGGAHTPDFTFDYKVPDEHIHSWDSDYTVDKDPTCTENGSKSIHCKTCDEVKNTTVVPATGHKFGNWTVEKEATAESDGIESRQCQRCGYKQTNTIEYIPAPDKDAPKIYADSVNARAGEEVEIRVKIENNPGITALRLVVDYDDTVLEMTGFTFGDALSSMNKGTSENFGNQYSFSMYSATADLTDNGTLAVIKFKVNENAEDGEYPIRITYDSDDIFNLNGDSIHFDTVTGIVTVNSCLPGDVNDDGKINMRDVVLLQQVVNGWNVAYNKDAADYNGDGKINMRDIVALQQYING